VYFALAYFKHLFFVQSQFPASNYRDFQRAISPPKCNQSCWTNQPIPVKRNNTSKRLNLVPCCVSRMKGLAGRLCFPICEEGTTRAWHIGPNVGHALPSPSPETLASPELHQFLCSHYTISEKGSKTHDQTCRLSSRPPTRFEAFGKAAPSRALESRQRRKALLTY